MKTFKLIGEVTISIYTEVKAETLEDAIEEAEERDIEKAKWRDKNQIKEVWVTDEYDGLPKNIKEGD